MVDKKREREREREREKERKLLDWKFKKWRF